MPPKAKKDTLLFVVNIGATKPGAESDPAFLRRARSIVSRMIEHRIFMRPKDEIGIVLMGSPGEANTENLKEYAPIQVPNWDLIEEIQDLKGTSCRSNWIKAVEVAVNILNTSGDWNSRKRIILISDFNEDASVISEFDKEDVLKPLVDNSIQLHAIGEDSLSERTKGSLRPSEQFLKDLLDENIGVYRTFEEVRLLFRYYEDTPKSPYPWYCTLDLLDKQIPIASYIKIDDNVKFPVWVRVKDDERVKRMTEYIDRHRRVYRRDEIETGYKYGGKLVPCTTIDNRDMEYKSGEKSYRIHSFTSADRVGMEYWCSRNTRIILPSKKGAAKPFYSLVQAMEKRNLVAIVRKIYSRNNVPKMVALFPCINVPDEPWCLIEIELPFAEDRRVMMSRPVRSVLKQLSTEQHELVDNLLDSFTIDDDEDSQDSGDCRFEPGSMHNPCVQHRWHALSGRALRPSEPLPEMEDYLKNAFEPPAPVKERARPYLEKIKVLFDLENVNPKAEEKARIESMKEDRTDSFAKPDIEMEPADKDASMTEASSLVEEDEFDIDIAKLADNI